MRPPAAQSVGPTAEEEPGGEAGQHSLVASWEPSRERRGGADVKRATGGIRPRVLIPGQSGRGTQEMPRTELSPEQRRDTGSSGTRTEEQGLW